MNHRDATPTSQPIEEIDHFLTWCWAALGWEVASDESGVSWLRVPEPLRVDLGGCEAIPVSATASANTPSWMDILQVLGKLDRAAHAAPASQPTSVHQLTPRLFDAYTVEAGRVMLGGGTLEDLPLLRATGLVRSEESGEPLRLVHRFSTIEGQTVEPKLLASLHLDDLAPLRRPPRLPPGDLPTWLATARMHLPAAAPDERIEPLVVTIVWCKYFRCKLTFEIGDARAELPFSSWAQWLIDGDASPPPFRCRHTDRESFHVVRTDDGLITVPEATAICEQTGRRVLETSLATCELTGRRVLRDLLAACPISGQQVLASELVTCAMCGQPVSPKSMAGQQCHACRALRNVRRDDPRMAIVFGSHPKLEQWSRWRLSETATVYILRGSSFFRQLLVVVDRESLDPLRLAESTFLSRRWSPIAPELWHESLG
ncbi:MAG: hypothetical protein KJ000_26365 [Pirellulaceae bacterium]|nr:hypothetical protein [Pirellulaceae bacterium]